MVYAAVGNCDYVVSEAERYIMDNTDRVLGPFLFYSATTFLLIGIVLALAGNYYSAFWRASSGLKLYVFGLMVFSILKGVQVIGLQWRKFIVLYGDFANVIDISWVERIDVLLTTIGAIYAQLYLIHRVHAISSANPPHKTIGLAFVGLQVVGVLLELVGAIWITVALPTQYVESSRVTMIHRLSAGAHMSTNVLITASTLWFLFATRAVFKPEDNMYNKFLSVFLGGALPPLVLAFLWMVFAGIKEVALSTFASSTLPSLEAICVLFVLNSRAVFRTPSSAAQTQAQTQRTVDPSSNAGGIAITVSQFDNRLSVAQVNNAQSTDSLGTSFRSEKSRSSIRSLKNIGKFDLEYTPVVL